MSYRGLRIWRALKRHPHTGAHDLAEILGWTVNVVAKALTRLKADGCVNMHGKRCSHTTKWTATNFVPRDKRGRSPANLKALVPYQKFAQARLKKAIAAKGCKLKAPPVPKPAIALEEFWPVNPAYVRIRQDGAE